MKLVLQFLLLCSLIFSGLKAQEFQNKAVELVYYEKSSKETPQDFKCDTCLLQTYFHLDTLTIKILSPDNCAEGVGSFEFKGDSLFLFSGQKPDYIDTLIVYNEETHENDTSIRVHMSLKLGPTHCLGIINFKLAGINKIPGIIIFRHKVITSCINRKSFDLYKNDTINLIDTYGLKQGTWLEYYENGKIKNEDTYQDGKIQIGYEYNQKGKVISVRSDIGIVGTMKKLKKALD